MMAMSWGQDDPDGAVMMICKLSQSPHRVKIDVF